MTGPSRALLPQPVYEALRRGERSGEGPAVAVFVDLEGFTALSERLMAKGQEGAEQVARVIDSVFTPLVETVHRHGGFIAGFAGDAFTAVFPAPHVGAPHALAAAHALREAGQGAEPSSLRVGVGSGTFRWSWSDAARVLLTGGSAVTAAVAAESHALSGDVVLHPSVAADCATAAVGDGFARLVGAPPRAPAPVPTRLDQDPAVLTRFVPPEEVDGSRDGEFRWVVSVFAQFDDPDPDAVHRFLATVAPWVARRGGTVARAAVGDKGATILFFWGAPIAVERPVERALGFLREVLLRHPTPQRLRAGLTSERVFAGLVGGAGRVEYTAYGGGITLAARLCAAAPWGDVHAAGSVAGRLDPAWTEALGPRSFKGFRHPLDVLALRPGDADAPREASIELHGRDADLAWLTQHVDAALAGDGPRVVVVGGPAGVGKSSLVAAARALRPGLRWVRGVCDEHDRGALRPFEAVVRDLLGLSDASPSPEQLRSAPAWPPSADPHAELLAGWLGGRTGAWERLTGRERRDALRAALQTLLVAAGADRPLALHLDDLQWLDAESTALVRHLAGAGSGVIVLTSRPRRGELPSAPAEAATRVLTGLGPAGVGALAARALGGPCAPSLARSLHDRTGGNPFFVAQLVRSLRESGALEEEDGGWRLATEHGAALPASLQEVLVARLDRLARPVREVVLAAAILGLSFSPGLHDGLVERSAVSERADAAGAGVLEPAEPRWAFVHGLMQDAAYGLQPVTARRTAHRRAASLLIARHGTEPGRAQATIADHLLRAGDEDAALPHIEAACAHFRAHFDVDSHTHWGARLRALYRARPALRDARLAFVRTETATLAMVPGGRATALQILEEELGLPARLPESPPEVLRREAARVLDGDAAEQGALVHLVRTWLVQCAMDQAGGAALDVLRELVARIDRPAAATTPDPSVIGNLRRSLGALEYRFGARSRAAELLTASVAPLEQAGDHEGVIAARQRLARLHWVSGRLDAADTEVVALRDAAARWGTRRDVGDCALQESLIALDRGELDRALTAAEEGEQAHRAAHVAPNVLIHLSTQATVHAVRGDAAGADRAMAAARALVDAGASRFMTATLARVEGEVAWRLDRWEQARSRLDEALAGARASGYPHAIADVAIQRAELAIRTDDPEGARALAQEVAGLLGEGGASHDRAWLDLLWARLDAPADRAARLAPWFAGWERSPQALLELPARLVRAEAAVALGEGVPPEEAAGIRALLDRMGIGPGAQWARQAAALGIRGDSTAPRG